MLWCGLKPDWNSSFVLFFCRKEDGWWTTTCVFSLISFGWHFRKLRYSECICSICGPNEIDTFREPLRDGLSLFGKEHKYILFSSHVKGLRQAKYTIVCLFNLVIILYTAIYVYVTVSMNVLVYHYRTVLVQFRTKLWKSWQWVIRVIRYTLYIYITYSAEIQLSGRFSWMSCWSALAKRVWSFACSPSVRMDFPKVLQLKTMWFKWLCVSLNCPSCVTHILSGVSYVLGFWG